MTGETVTISGLVAVSVLSLIIITMSVVLLTGKGSFFIAGFNTMSREEKERYDKKALCIFLGKILLPIGLLLPFVVLGGALWDLVWPAVVFSIGVFGLIIFACVYANTGDRFRKNPR